MGRHHALKPSHLCVSSPPQSSRASFLAVKNHVRASSLSFLQGTSTTAIAVGDHIPGLKVSAAFLSNLQSNIFIDIDSCPGSGTTTPDSLRPTSYHIPPSPLAFAISTATVDDGLVPPSTLLLPKPEMDTKLSRQQSSNVPAANNMDDIPELTTFVATDTDSKVEALHLLADSVAQQRNMGSRALIYSPITVAILAVGFAFLKNLYTTNGKSDWTMIGTTFTGIIMCVFAAVRRICDGYIDEAEKVGSWKWLNEGRPEGAQENAGDNVLGDQDEVLLTKFGDDYIGTIVFRGVRPTPAGSGNETSTSGSPNRRSRKAKTSSMEPPKLQIRGWTVAQKYRRKGVGGALIEEALKTGKDKGWTVGGVEFANDHANHRRILPGMFNGAFMKMEQIGQKTLDAKWKEVEADNQNQDKKRKK